MKKLLAILLSAFMVLAMAACGEKEPPVDPNENPETPAYKIAMVTDYGDITDQSFNQTTYEACKAFAEANKIDFTYKKPASDSTADRVGMIEQAIDEGYNVIVMPGFAFAEAIVQAAPNYPDVKFIALDVSSDDLLAAGVALAGEEYDFKPANWDFAKYVKMDNVYSAVYQEEICGYMAGYAAVKLGYEKLGFLGGMAVPAVVRYGYGFVQGVDAAAKELNKNVELNYVYGNKFVGTPDITAAMDTWYKGGTQIVFACGGGIYTSAVDASKKVEGSKVIGVDVDQAAVIAKYAGDADNSRTLTSAMKGLYPTTFDTLTDVIVNGNWEKYAGKVATLGLVNGDDPTLNYVQLPMESTQFGEGFTQDDYKALVKAMVDGTVKVSNDTSKMPETTNVKVNDQGALAG